MAEDPNAARVDQVRRRLLKASGVAAGALATGHLPWTKPAVKSFFGVRSAYAQPTGMAPVASFAISIVGTVVTVTDQSTMNPTSLLWDWGDASLPENGVPGESRMHDYGAGSPGMTFTVTLTASNSFGSDSVMMSVTIPPLPVASFTFSIAGTVVTVTDQSTMGPTSLVWDWGDGSPPENGSPGESRMHDYVGASSGMTFTVTLTAANPSGSDSVVMVVTIP